MSFKIPCGGFKLDEKSFSLDKNDALSITKPISYDYMPEGYPSKSIETVTLMEEQEVTFFDDGGYIGQLTDVLEIVVGQTYTVNWDGTEYECVCAELHSAPSLGNLSLIGEGDDTGEPFIYIPAEGNAFMTRDTSASHTISVTTVREVITPMAREFLPSGVNELIMNSSTPDSNKKFKITVDDSGTISATEVT